METVQMNNNIETSRTGLDAFLDVPSVNEVYRLHGIQFEQ